MREPGRKASKRRFCDVYHHEWLGVGIVYWEVLRMYTVLEVMCSGFIGVELVGYLIY